MTFAALAMGYVGIDSLVWIPSIVGALFVLFYFGAPLIVLFRHRRSPSPDVTPREPSLLPAPADEFFNVLGPVLADLGFGETQRWAFQGFVANVVADLCTMTDRRRRVIAVATVTHVKKQGAFRLHSQTVEFASRTEDGRTLVTTNTLLTLILTTMGPRRIVLFPGLRDLALLLKAHEALVSREFGDSPLRDPGKPADFPERLRRTLEEAHEWQEQAGWVRKQAGGQIRLTLKGAYLQTWAQLPPFKQLIRRRIRARAAALLAELGLKS